VRIYVNVYIVYRKEVKLYEQTLIISFDVVRNATRVPGE